MRIRQRMEQRGVDDAEERRRDSDRHRQRRDRDERRSPITPQQSNRVANVLKDRVHVALSSRFAFFALFASYLRQFPPPLNTFGASGIAAPSARGSDPAKCTPEPSLITAWPNPNVPERG